MNKKIKIGLWGVGRAGLHGHLNEIDKFSDFFQVVAACDLIEERADKVAERYPSAVPYIDCTDFLADKNIDLVSIATYSSDHVKHAQMALEAGK